VRSRLIDLVHTGVVACVCASRSSGCQLLLLEHCSWLSVA
jgi:hypothetical protein